jgi:GDP-mannose 6-dehydrogenase
MKIGIFGLGYVGSVSAACFVARGHQVIGVDVNTDKVNLINKGVSPVVEPGLQELIAEGVAGGMLRASFDAAEAVREADISVLCVPTPSRANGGTDLQYIETVCRQIGASLKGRHGFHTVVVRSTVPAGTIRNVVIPTLERQTGRIQGDTFAVCANPEFLREGSAISDFFDPPKTICGATDPRAFTVIDELYGWLSAPRIHCAIEVAEMIKTIDNAWHATKVVFANEVGNLCKTLAIDSHEVMSAFCVDTKLNLSPYYLTPGFAFGGSCLPKDLRSLNHLARGLGVETPLLGSLAVSNRQQIERGLNMIMDCGKKAVGFAGLSFKDNTDDLRESPLLEVIERLIGKGFDVRIYDPNVNIARLVGSNRSYLMNAVPHIERLLVDGLEDLLAHAEVVVIGNRAHNADDFATRLRPEQRVIDFIRLGPVEEQHPNYDGICW